ncbi:LAME_0B04632g1_1 [Lachancea meyersii CBS 8951]|uniref:LAME_0B04632g1_1 n=1 Tax=Lachancea meyersii CBS 8951 TaxID=1266667 RepID=A0A1G4IV46_9SACH|nr:LAME_0B04632g1_1 [Lachancea meyersii CBS 8951]
MVFCRRKPLVLPAPRPLPANINVRVWHINETGEWFLKYTEYLERMDFYMRRQFSCEITGSSFLTFFEALNSEETEFRLVEERFPLKLREPVAKFMHFNEIGRVDLLVERAYSRFKADFYPGERVFLRRKSDKVAEDSAPNAHKSYIVKEKASFNAVFDLTGSQVIKPAFSKYMITEEFGANSLMVDQHEIYRDRTSFTKHLIKCFCKITLRRASAKSGAPLCVKDEYLAMYGLTLDWPVSMLKYKEEVPEPRLPRPNSQLAQNGSKPLPCPPHNQNNAKRSIDNPNNDTENKKQKSTAEPTTCPSPAASAVEDSTRPYNGPNRALKNAFYYNKDLDHVPVTQPGQRFEHMYKLLEVFQFCQTFSKVLLLSPFSLDNFIRSLKSTGPKATALFTIKGRVNSPLFEQKSSTKTVDLDGDENLQDTLDRAEKRCPGIRDLVENQSSSLVSFEVSAVDENESVTFDNVESSGTSLIIECFVALERLFVNESGDWNCMVMDKWYDEDEMADLPAKPESVDAERDVEDSKDDTKQDDDTFTDPEIDVLLERCLNFRKVSWTERLSKRQFKNGFWIIVLLGIFQDCMHIPMYTSFAHRFIRAVVPSEGSATHLNKILWQNFCENLSLEDKLYALWILVDIASNFSQDIKTYVEDTLDVCTQIRSEKLKLSKRLKSEMQSISQLSNDQDQSNEIQSQIDNHQAAINKINHDREYLTQKLIENDVRRLRPLGSDRNGNKYYWQELSGVPRISKDDNHEIGSGRIWVRGISVRDAERLLELPSDKLTSWKKLASESSIFEATAKTFQIARTNNAALVCETNAEDPILVFPDGSVNTSLIDSSPLYRKIVDETPENILLSESLWVSIENLEDVNELMQWAADDVANDQVLSKQMRAIKEPLMESLKRRRGISDASIKSTEMQRLEHAIAVNSISESEINQCQIDNEEKQIVDDDEELEKIATEIMELDDGRQTKTSLNRIRELEERRDYLLNARTFKEHTERQQSRALRKKAISAIEEKVRNQEAALSFYMNKVTQISNPSEKLWTNELARKLWNTSLYLGASGKPVTRNKLSVKERMTEIFDGMTSTHQKRT